MTDLCPLYSYFCMGMLNTLFLITATLHCPFHGRFMLRLLPLSLTSSLQCLCGSFKVYVANYLVQMENMFLSDVILIDILILEGRIIADDQSLQEGAPNTSWQE